MNDSTHFERYSIPLVYGHRFFIIEPHPGLPPDISVFKSRGEGGHFEWLRNRPVPFGLEPDPVAFTALPSGEVLARHVTTQERLYGIDRARGRDHPNAHDPLNAVVITCHRGGCGNWPVTCVDGRISGRWQSFDYDPLDSATVGAYIGMCGNLIRGGTVPPKVHEAIRAHGRRGAERGARIAAALPDLARAALTDRA